MDLRWNCKNCKPECGGQCQNCSEFEPKEKLSSTQGSYAPTGYIKLSEMDKDKPPVIENPYDENDHYERCQVKLTPDPTDNRPIAQLLAKGTLYVCCPGCTGIGFKEGSLAQRDADVEWYEGKIREIFVEIEKP